MDKRQIAKDIFLAAVDSVKPDNLIKKVCFNKSEYFLELKIWFLNMSVLKNIYVVGAGKASAAMAETMETVLGSRITAGHIITKYDHSVPLEYIEITEAGHPVPDENGIRGTQQILSMITKAGEKRTWLFA